MPQASFDNMEPLPETPVKEERVEEEDANISSDDMGDIFAKDASNGLSYEKMIYNYQKKHPHRKVEEWEKESVGKDFVAHPICCSTKTGNLSCCTRFRRSDLENYGSGVVIFFQFLKALFWIFFVCTLCNIPSMYIFYKANPLNSASEVI